MNRSMDESGDATPDYSSMKADSSTGTPLRPSFPPHHDEDPEDRLQSSSDEGGDPEESFHNPEPPAALLESSRELFTADNIGDTVYSKHWLFTTLMNLIQAVENHASAKETDESVGIDLDENLQDELCKLWDMSMNEAVISFLLEFKVSEILMGVLERSKAPRATEICLGILGNMCCNEAAAGVIASNEKLVNLILMHLNETDTPTLNETMRCLYTCVSSSVVRGIWCEAIQNEPSIFDNCRFILQSSTNTDLLKNASQFIDEVMDADENICEMWSSSEMVLAVLEAVNQFGVGHYDDLTCLFHILQLLSTNESGVLALVSEAEAVSKLLLLHLVEVCDDEIVGVLGRENFFASLFSVFNTILSGCDVGKSLVQKDFQLVRCVLKALDVIYPTMNKDPEKDVSRRYRRRRTTSSGSGSPRREDNGKKTEVNGNGSPSDDKDKSEEEYNETMVGLLYETMQSLLADVVVVICPEVPQVKEPDADKSNSADKLEEGKTDSKLETSEVDERGDKKDVQESEKDRQNNNVSVTLSYFNDQCSRERLYFMIWSLRERTSTDQSESTGTNYFELLQNAAKANNLERLTRILVDAKEF